MPSHIRPLRILVAPNAFKESLSAGDAARAIARGLRRGLPNARVTEVPIADGGDGTLEAVITETGGRILKAKVTGPLGNRITAEYGITGDGQTAVIEMSRASGLALVPLAERNPMHTTSLGTGELIRAALDRGASRILLGIGGSATVDGGIGALQALGVSFLDHHGKPVGQGGAGLLAIETIELNHLHPKLKRVDILVACDVDNPLTGPKGAAAVFGPQKGATPAIVVQLDHGLERLAAMISQTTGRKFARIPGTGAAGGIAGSFLGLLGARLRPGSELVFDLLKLDTIVPTMDWVITGEGQIDFQTQFGKGPGMLAKLAARHGVPVVGIAGSVADDAGKLSRKGFTALFSLTNRPMDLATAMQEAPRLVERIAEQVARLIRAGITPRR
ncbi:MAG: glycerate kinase [Acidobacteria bacterium]|nr:glycerate kinase [Acidobacteriota bacterium]